VHDTGEGHGELHAEQLVPQRRHELLDEGVDVLLVDEARLDVELGELRLAVGAQVLVAEAAGDLVVALDARDHQQLLEQLWRLRQGVDGARRLARGHQEVPCPSGVERVSTGVSMSTKPWDSMTRRMMLVARARSCSACAALGAAPWDADLAEEVQGAARPIQRREARCGCWPTCTARSVRRRFTPWPGVFE